MGNDKVVSLAAPAASLVQRGVSLKERLDSNEK